MKNPQTISDMQSVAEKAFERASEYKLPTIAMALVSTGVAALGLYGVAAATTAITALMYVHRRGHEKRGNDITRSLVIAQQEVAANILSDQNKLDLARGDFMMIAETTCEAPINSMVESCSPDNHITSYKHNDVTRLDCPEIDSGESVPEFTMDHSAPEIKDHMPEIHPKDDYPYLCEGSKSSAKNSCGSCPSSSCSPCVVPFRKRNP